MCFEVCVTTISPRTVGRYDAKLWNVGYKIRELSRLETVKYIILCRLKVKNNRQTQKCTDFNEMVLLVLINVRDDRYTVH